MTSLVNRGGEEPVMGCSNSAADNTAFTYKKKKCNTWNEISKESQGMFVQKYLLVGGDPKAIGESSVKHEVLGKYLNRLGRNKTMAVEILDTFCQGLSINVVDELRHVLWNHNRPIVKRWIYDQVSQLFEQKLKEGEIIYNESSSLKESLSLKELAMIKRRVRRHNGSSRKSYYNQMAALSTFIGSADRLPRSSSSITLSASTKSKSAGMDDASVCTPSSSSNDISSSASNENDDDTNTNTNTTVDNCDEDVDDDDSSDDDDDSDDESSGSDSDSDDIYELLSEDKSAKDRGRRFEGGSGKESPFHLKGTKASPATAPKTPEQPNIESEKKQQQQQKDEEGRQQQQQPATRTRHGSISMRNPFSGLYNKHIRSSNNQQAVTASAAAATSTTPILASPKRPVKERSMSTVTPPTIIGSDTQNFECFDSSITSPSPSSEQLGSSSSRKRALIFKPTIHNFETLRGLHGSGDKHHNQYQYSKIEDKKGTLEPPKKHQTEETFITKIRTKYRNGSTNPLYVRPKPISDEFLVKCDAKMVVDILRGEERLRWDDKESVDYWSSRFAPRERWEPLSPEATQRLCPSISAKALLAGWNIEFSYISVTHEHPESEKPTILDGTNDYPYYSEFIAKVPHDNYISKDGPCIVSVESKPKAGTSCRAIVRTALHTERILLPPDNPMKALRKFLPIVKDSTFVRAKEAGIISALVNYDEKQYTKCHKIGLLYCKDHVKDENELFSARTGSKAYNDFLSFIGVKISLKGWDKYDGGLDTEDNMTGEYSVYNEFRGHEIMFHVCTMLPFKEKDNQHLDRKRHIGNDVVVIVFKDSCDKDDAFDPAIFKNSVFVITPVLDKDGNTSQYQVSIANKSCVPPYPPFIPKDFVFPRTQVFRKFLLTKLINAERTDFNSGEFRITMSSARNHLLTSIYDSYK